ncbi:hypothetical protein B9Z55_026682 [Caenorhabditis nigoni]|nr:hypothetical protein B9Z55_026682 [Caenorhabditis nigoni]
MDSAAKLRRFEATDKTDVVLVVDDEKFHVEKKYVAEKSDFFRGLLLGSCKESKQSEVDIHGFDPTDFRAFLGVLHEQPTLTDENAAMLVIMSNYFVSESVARKCYSFIWKSKNIKVITKSEEVSDFMVKFF